MEINTLTAAAARVPASAFIDIQTVHQANVTWWWTEDKLRDVDHHVKVQDDMYAKVAELEKKHDITHDTRFCCQWEGVQVFGDKLSTVKAAVKELAAHLARYEGVVPLNL